MCPWETCARLAAWACVFLAVVSANSEINIYKKVGDEVVLRPVNTSVTGAIATIIWTHGVDIAIQSDAMGVDSYRQFKERGSLNLTTGEMTIRGLTPDDSGMYTSEINEVKGPSLRLTVIAPVPKPTVGQSCDNESTSCTLTCDGDTAGAGPVTYRWRSGDEGTAGSKDLSITKDGSSGVNEFSCELENPVSRESSQPVPNPLATSETPTPTPGVKLNVNMGAVVFVSLLVGVLGLVGAHRCKTGTWFFQKTSMPWEPDFWRGNERLPGDAAESNGRTTQGQRQIDEETPLS